MGVRPPQNDSSPPDAIEFGIAALDARLDEADLEFPATQEEVLLAVDNTAIPYNAAGRTLELAVALEKIPKRHFENEIELLDQLHPVFERQRRTASGGIVSRLRALLPF
jgi:hypothetical protein